MNKVTLLVAILCLAACTADDSTWKGGIRMTVDWSHYTDATSTCRRIEAERLGKDAGTIEPDDNCLRLDGQHCYVLTSDHTPDRRFGELVRACFDRREALIDQETP